LVELGIGVWVGSNVDVKVEITKGVDEGFVCVGSIVTVSTIRGEIGFCVINLP
jgi:hypothetical protein